MTFLQSRFLLLLKNSKRSSVKLAVLGRFDEQKLEGNYATGQLFLHRVFGSRGVILCPWSAKLYDRDLFAKAQPEPSFVNSDAPASRETQGNYTSTGKGMKGSKELQYKEHTYYTVLMNLKDCELHRGPVEAVTFLGTQDPRAVFTIPGMDYVAHEDVIPYSTTEDRLPIQHPQFERFLTYLGDEQDPPFGGTHELSQWVEKYYTMLEVTEVHRETTDGIRVTVMPFFLGAVQTATNPTYWWRYHIRLENMGPHAATLRHRSWRIFSLSGVLETINGQGVVGHQPTLDAKHPAFQYGSQVSLHAPSGHMWGSYRMERESGEKFDVRIPPFCLESNVPEESPVISL